jgi:penicillin-binding protein 1A
MKRIKRKLKQLIKKAKTLLLTLSGLMALTIVSYFSLGLLYTLVILTIVLIIIGIVIMFGKWGKGKKGHLIRNYLLIGISLFGTIIILFASAFLIYVVINAPNFNPENLYKKEATILYDSKNNMIAKLGAEKREIVSYEDLPQVLIDAIIATEDARYYQHIGFDLPRFLKASLGQLTGNRDAGGASTLSMQVVRNNFTSTDQSILRKFTDIYLAIFKLEKKYTKEQILEFYVNIPYLGSNNSYGVEQACQTYFNKSVRDINLAEASLLAGMFQAPSAYNPIINPEAAKKRQRTVLYLMRKHGYISAKEEQIAASIPIESLIKHSTDAKREEFQDYIDTVVEEIRSLTGYNPYNTPMIIYTNMDIEKQTHLNDIMSGKKFKFANDVVQTGIAVIEVNTGKIIAIGAGRNEGALKFNFATMIKRQPGSTVKPFFDYGPGMEYNNWSTYTPFLDVKYQYSDGTPIKNWDGKYMGLMTLRKALDESRNIPALKAFQSVNNKKVLQFAQSVGLKPEISDGKIHEAHAIGGYNGSSPVEMAGAFATLANGGYYIKPHSVSKIEYRETGMIQQFTPKKERVMSDSTAFMLTDILHQSVANGFNSSLKINNVNIAAKSGTTNYDERTMEAYKLPKTAINDAWVIGYSPDYVVSLWYGYENISNKYYNTTVTAFNARSALFKAVGNGIFPKDNKKFSVPKNVVKVKVEKETIPAMLASEYTPTNMILTEYFKKGTEPTEVSPRFNKIRANVTNLEAIYDSNSNSYILTWNPVNAPDFLTDEYFINNYKSTLGGYTNTYLEKYKAFNNSTLGKFGYLIYSKNKATGDLTFIEFTDKNSFSEVATTSSKTYVVKTGFSIFRSNASDGVEVTIGDENVIEQDLNIELSDQTPVFLPISEGTYIPPGVTVKLGEEEISTGVSISYEIVIVTGETPGSPVDEIDTSFEATYRVDYTVTYRGKTYTKVVIDGEETTTNLEYMIIVSNQ